MQGDPSAAVGCFCSQLTLELTSAGLLAVLLYYSIALLLAAMSRTDTSSALAGALVKGFAALHAVRLELHRPTWISWAQNMVGTVTTPGTPVGRY